jgi:hypothetical protein
VVILVERPTASFPRKREPRANKHMRGTLDLRFRGGDDKSMRGLG